MASPDEGALILACQRGDSAAMRSLYDLHAGRILALAWRVLGRRDDAEDVLQETFLRAWRSIERFEGRAGFGSWLYRIALNLCRDHIRRKRPQLPEGEAPVTQQTGDVIARQHLAQALDRLPQGYREVLVMHDVMELEHPEIAEILGVEVGTCKSQLHKARARMRQLLFVASQAAPTDVTEAGSHV